MAMTPAPLMCCLVADPPSPEAAADRHSLGEGGQPCGQVLEDLARACSPDVYRLSAQAVIFNAAGLTRIIGPPIVIGEEVGRMAAEQGVMVRIALAGHMTSACLLAHARLGVTIVRPGGDAAALAPLPIGWLSTLDQAEGRGLKAAGKFYEAFAATLSRWGIRTLGEYARLPREEVHARFGAEGVRLHQAAAGENVLSFAADREAPKFLERIELEWPIEGLEPLSFVLARLCEPLALALERADRGAVTVTTRVRLTSKRTHERTLNLPAPMRDARVLRTLILVDLESHPPDASMDVVEIELGVTPGRIVQGTLLAQALPSPEDVSTLLARLRALFGESRVGAPALVDTHDERNFSMETFLNLAGSEVPGFRGSRVRGVARRTVEPRTTVEPQNPLEPRNSGTPEPLLLRRFRLPLAARVRVEHGAPVRVDPAARGLAGGRVVSSAGPWRTSGQWWALDRTNWDRDEWDVELADGCVLRISRDRISGQWEVHATLD